MQAQTYKGILRDQAGKPVSFANILLYALPDSSFITGTMSDNKGVFLLESPRKIKGFIKVSCLGYQPYTAIAKPNMRLIRLQEDVNVLNDVVVKAKRPKIKQVAGKIVLEVQGSSLSDAGTLMDVFKRTPGLKVTNETLSVFGRGTPLVFINGRQVRNPSEYQSLQSDDIATIEIDRNPSAKYDASTTSVVHIKTKKEIKDRVNLQVFNRSFFARKYSNVIGLDLNSKWDKTQISLNYSYILTQSKVFEDAYENNTQPNYTILNQNQSDRLNKGLRNNLFASIVQQVGKKQELGFQYSTYLSNSTNKEDIRQQIKKTNLPEIRRLVYSETEDESCLSTYNVNYTFKIDSLNKLQVMGDYTQRNLEDISEILERNLNTTTRQKMHLNNQSNYHIYSVKTDFKTALMKTIPLEIGLKFSAVEDDGKVIGTDKIMQAQIYQTEHQSVNQIGAGYLLASKTIKDWRFEAGLRYEYTDRNILKSSSSVLDTSYSGWFPSFNISRDIGEDVNLSLSYSKTIDRPSFGELSSSRSYIDSLSYSVGNPDLRATIDHNVSFSIGLFESVFLSLDYTRTHKGRMMTALNDEQNPDIVVYKSINIDKAENFSADVNYHTSFKFWELTYGVGMEQPYTKIMYLGKNRTVDKLSYYVYLNNDFTISDNINLFGNFYYSSPSEDLMTSYEKTYTASLGVNSSFFDKKLKLSLMFYHYADMIWRDRFGRLESYSEQDFDQTLIRFSVTYNFNKYREGIRKKTAGSEEIKRM